MDWKDISVKIMQKLLIGTVALLGMKAVENVIDGKDVLGRDPNPEKTRFDRYKGEVHLGTDDYEVI